MITSRFFKYTVYAKQAPLPHIGDEHYPDGGVGITFKPTPNLTVSECYQIAKDLIAVAESMKRKEKF